MPKLFPFETTLADGRSLWVHSAGAAGPFSLQAEGEQPLPLDDPKTMMELSLVLELCAQRMSYDHSDPRKADRS